MAKTKYIVDNVANQTISGNVTINGNLNVTGTTSGLATYKALLTQLGSQTGTTLNGFGGFNDGLIIGETYTITDYIGDDDFSNIANVISGGILNFDYDGTSIGYGGVDGVTGTTSGLGSESSFNVYWCGTTYNIVNLVNSGVDYVVGDTITILGTDVSGSTPANDITITVTEVNPNVTASVFIATGEIPTNWSNGSTLVSSGNLVVKVLENNLGFEIEWVYDNEFQPGFYLGFNSTTGPLYNNFNRNTTFVLGGGTAIPFFGPFLLETFMSPISFNEKDDSIVVAVFGLGDGPTPVSDSLYYFPIEIQIKQDLNVTPIVISGTVESSFPITLPYIDLRCNGNYIQGLYGDGTVNDMSELITYLNSETNTSYLGVYSDAGDGGVLLEMPTNLVNQFCSSGTLTFEVFSD
jgi:hypothetical protein